MGDDYGTFRATVTKQLEVLSRNQEKSSKGPRETESEFKHRLEKLDAKLDALTEAMRRKTHNLMDSITKMQGADVDAQGPYGSALQRASLNGHKEVVKMLRDARARD
nr:hypothetical protein B0A51_03068 [Rachicladosporium sp. CCFEE 5018]